MSTATSDPTGLGPIEVPGHGSGVPSLDEIRRLTDVPDRRVVFRGGGWDFYEALVDAIPEGSDIHVDYVGKDLEILARGVDHQDYSRLLGAFIAIVAQELRISYKGLAETTWKRAATTPSRISGTPQSASADHGQRTKKERDSRSSRSYKS